MKKYLDIFRPQRRLFPFVPVRYVVATMCFFGTLCLFFVKLSLAIAVTGMVKSANVVSNNESSADSPDWQIDPDKCPGIDINDPYTGSPDGDLEWSNGIMELVFQSFNIGFVATQLLGGRLGEIYGNVRVMGLGLLTAGILCLISPLAAKINVYVFIPLRVLQGMTAGSFFAPLHSMIKIWFSREETQRISSIIFSAMFMSYILSMGISNVLEYEVEWEGVFSIYGSIVVFWSLCFLIFVHDSPEDDPFISSGELEYIRGTSGSHKHSTNKNKPTPPVPWISILTSRQVWAATIMHAGVVYVTYTFLVELPKYSRKVIHYDLEKTGYTIALPCAFGWLGCILSGFLSQYLQKIKFFTRITTYKVFNGFAVIVSSLCLFLLEFSECDANSTMALFVVSILALSAFYGGSSINILDLAPNFTGSTAGISLTFVTVMIAAPSLVATAVTEGNQTLSQWHMVFYIATGVIVISYMVFLLFASERPRSWDTQDFPTVFENPREIIERRASMIFEAISRRESIIIDPTSRKECEIFTSNARVDTTEDTGQRKQSVINIIRKKSRIEGAASRKNCIIHASRKSSNIENLASRKDSVVHPSRKWSAVENTISRKDSIVCDCRSRKDSRIVIIEQNNNERKRKESVYDYV